MPQSVKDAIGRRLSRLSEPTIDALRTAAALGKVFAFRELRRRWRRRARTRCSTRSTRRAARSSLRTATDRSRRRFVFTHDKIREVLYEELNPIRRRRLHQRIGEALEGSTACPTASAGDRAQDLAYHFLQAGDFRARSVTHRAAANAERVFAHDEALKFLEQAREAAEALNRPGDVVAIDEAIGDIYRGAGVIRPAVEATNGHWPPPTAEAARP